MLTLKTLCSGKGTAFSYKNIKQSVLKNDLMKHVTGMPSNFLA